MPGSSTEEVAGDETIDAERSRRTFFWFRSKVLKGDSASSVGLKRFSRFGRIRRISPFLAILVASMAVMSIQVVQLMKLHTGVGDISMWQPSEIPEPHLLQFRRSTNSTISVCLFMMDDRIKLLEWIAYHFVVLPLGHLMVGIDPKSTHLDDVEEILNRWRPYFKISVLTNNTYITYSSFKEGWQGGQWDLDPNSTTYQFRLHHRNEKAFYMHCMRRMHQERRERVWFGDTDEYLIMNYIGPGEDENLYDTIGPGAGKGRIDRERGRILPFRKKLPPFSKRITIAQVLDEFTAAGFVQNPKKPDCIRFPDLRFSGYESRPEIIQKGVPDWIDPKHYSTLRFRHTGRKEGSFTKVMLNCSSSFFEKKSFISLNDSMYWNIHNPHKRLCGLRLDARGIFSIDYISALLRFHHYRTGTLESIVERGARDFRFDANQVESFFIERNKEVGHAGENDDIRDWMEWFVELVGEQEVRRLLTDPMDKAYASFSNFQYPSSLLDELNKYVSDNSTVSMKHNHSSRLLI